jgi:nucleoside 2-deoxyribosyltransferase
MNQKVYFAGSIRGGRGDASLYQEMIALINETDQVLTEQVGDLSRSILEQARDKDEEIYLQDIGRLNRSDLVIAECTVPSLGVGYELAYAEKLHKPVHIFYRPAETSLSAMLKGDRYFTLHPYENADQMKEEIRRILSEKKEKLS